jgi:hypothetical protein
MAAQVPPKEILDIVDAPAQPSLSYSPNRNMVRNATGIYVKTYVKGTVGVHG